MANRYFVLIVFGTTVSFSILGILRIQKAAMVSGDIFDASRRKQREREEYEAFYAPPVPRHHRNNKEKPPSSSSSSTSSSKQQQSNNNTQNHHEQYPPLLTHPQHKKWNIRSWGCEPRIAAPFIFVHIGKAGGGSVKAVIAASVTRSDWNQTTNKGDLSHPFQMGTSRDDEFSDAAVLISHFPQFRPSYNASYPLDTSEDWSTYEGTLPCAAETPIGQAFCPVLRSPPSARPVCHGTQCNLVYAGHNHVGNELHWLPNEYIAQWWKESQEKDYTDPIYNALLHRMDDWTMNNHQCYLPAGGEKNTTGQVSRHYKLNYEKCVLPKGMQLDRMTTEALPELSKLGDWSPLYASLPVLRVTVLREPMSWLVSKFFWHSKLPGYWRGLNGRRHYGLTKCDNSDQEVPGSDEHLDVVVDWVSHAALSYMHYLCGEDCVVRMEHGQMTLDQVEVQARNNLKHSFAVVGLLEEMPTFYRMLSARTKYLDTSSIKPDVGGKIHRSKVFGSVNDNIERCKTLFTSRNDFVRKITKMSPELAALRRLYRVGVEVSHSQRDELDACGSLPSEMQELGR